MSGVTYDTGALLAAERGDREMWKLHRGYRSLRIIPVVPAAALAEAWRGGARQANLARLLAVCDVEAMSEEQAKAVGVLAGKAGHDDVVDVAVVEGAARRGDAIVTSDAGHIRAIAQAAGRRVRIEQI